MVPRKPTSPDAPEAAIRILIADEAKDRLDALQTVVESLGHEGSPDRRTSPRWRLTTETLPDLSIVTLGPSSGHALDLIPEIVREASSQSSHTWSPHAQLGSRVASGESPTPARRVLDGHVAGRIPRRMHLPHCGHYEKRGFSPVTDASPLRVLLVEDHKGVRELIRVTLASEDDLCLCVASTVAEADALLTDTCGVVVTDLSLPDADGIRFVARLRESSKDLRIIAFSGSTERRDEAIAAGADAFVLKGGSIDELLDAIRGHRPSSLTSA